MTPPPPAFTPLMDLLQVSPLYLAGLKVNMR